MSFKYHNFKKVLAGYGYIAKSGDPSTTGLLEDEPRNNIATITGASRVIVGTGHYAAGIINNALEADGLVIIEGMNPTVRQAMHSGTSAYNRTGIIFKNVNFPDSSSTANASIDRCVLDDCTGGGITGPFPRWYRFLNSIVRNCGAGIGCTPGSERGHTVFEFCYITSSLVWALSVSDSHAAWSFKGNYVGPATTVLFAGISNPAYVTNNCIQGKIVIDGTTYELKKRKDGSPTPGTDPAIPDLATRPGWENIYTTGKNFNENPKANMSFAGVELQADSPLIRAGHDGSSSIGGALTRVATTVANTDDGNQAGTRVLPDNSINTLVPSAYIVKQGYSEGYVDYVFHVGGKPLSVLNLDALFTFNSDIAGGQIGNKNVPDAEPVTSEYPNWVTTSAANTALNLVTVPAGKIAVGQHIKVKGRPRLVISKTTSGSNDILTVDRDFTTAIGSGEVVTFGTVLQIAALTPNRLTVFMRIKTTEGAPSIPFVNSEWDNGIHASYGKAGYLFNQEINTRPALYIDGMNVYGSGDSDCPLGLEPQYMTPEYVHARVYLRENYSSRGLAA